MKLEKLLKAKDASHPVLAGLPEVVVPLMSTALQAADWWQRMTPPLDGWSVQDVHRGMDRLRELRFAVDHEASKLLKRHGKDARFPVEMLHRMVQAHRLNARERFATAVHDCLAALAGWKQKQKQHRSGAKRRGGVKRRYSDEFLKRVESDWRSARAAGHSKKEWAIEFTPEAAKRLGTTVRVGHEFRFCDKLLDAAQSRSRRRSKRD